MAALVAYKFEYLGLPPTWDAAMTVYPAAIELARSGFDLEHLLSLPTYSEGGPNLHSVSLITWLSAGAYMLFGFNSATYVFLHLVHLATAALGLIALYGFTQRTMSRQSAALVTVGIALWPIVMRQFGAIYLETPLFSVAALIALAALKRSWRWVAVLLTVALWIKLSAVFLVVALGAYLLTDSTGTLADNARQALGTLTVPVLAGVLIYSVTPTDEWSGGIEHLWGSAIYLRLMPFELVLLAFLTLLMVTLVMRRQPLIHDDVTRLSVLAMLSFTCFYLLLPAVGAGLPILPRYYMLFVPFAIIFVASHISKRSPLFLNIGLCVIAPILLLGQSGRLIPWSDIVAPSFAERFESGPQLVNLHRTQLQLAHATNDGSPIYYWRFTHFLSRYPELGYTTLAVPNGRYASDYEDMLQGDLPPRFRLLYDFPWLGGEVLRQVWQRVEADPDRSVEVREIRSGRFVSFLVTVGMKDSRLNG